MPPVPTFNNINNSVVSVNSSLVKPVTFNSLQADTRSLNALKSQAASDPQAAAREAAKQFESLFMGELVKSMRINTQQTGMLDNAGTQLGTELLDKQLAMQISGRPGGLSEAILQQLDLSRNAITHIVPTVFIQLRSLRWLHSMTIPFRRAF